MRSGDHLGIILDQAFPKARFGDHIENALKVGFFDDPHHMRTDLGAGPGCWIFTVFSTLFHHYFPMFSRVFLVYESVFSRYFEVNKTFFKRVKNVLEIP